MKPRPTLGLPALRAAELVDRAYLSFATTTPKAVVRQARRVLRSATYVMGTKARYPPGVVIYLAPSAPPRVRAVLESMDGDHLAEEIAKPLRTHTGRPPRFAVWIQPDPDMDRDFEVAVLERSEHLSGRGANASEPASDGLIGSVVREWAALVARVPPGQDPLLFLEQATGVPFRRLDAVRRTRNEAAHGGLVDRTKLAAALATIREVERRIPTGR